MALRVTLPLGISFYTSAVDELRHRRLPRPCPPPSRTSSTSPCFVSMFPQLVAGPIIRFSEIADQLRSRTSTPSRSSRGASRSSRLGLAKKVLLANPCGKIADLAFEAGSLGADRRLVRRHRVRVPDLLRFQRLLRHGHRPRADARVRVRRRTSTRPTSRSRSPSSGGAGTSRSRRGCATTCTSRSAATARAAPGPTSTCSSSCCIGGLWHGAAWNFVVWGGLHGALLAFERMRGKAALYGRLPVPVRVGADLHARAGHLGVLPRARPAGGDPLSGQHGRQRRRGCRRGAARRHRLSAVLPGHVPACRRSSRGAARRRGTGRARSRCRKRLRSRPFSSSRPSR